MDILGCFHVHYDANLMTYPEGKEVCQNHGGKVFEFTDKIHLEMQPFLDYLFANGGKNIEETRLQVKHCH